MADITDIKSIYDHSKPYKQHEFAKVVGVSEKTISLLVSKGVLHPGQILGEWIIRYTTHLREQAAGRATNGDIDLATERAGLAKEQRLRLEMQNAVMRREYGPIIEMELGLADMLSMTGSKLDTIVGKLKKRSDVLTSDDLDIVSQVIADVRNDIAETTIDWFDAASEIDDED